MEKMILLLLFVFSLSTADLLNNEILEQSKSRSEILTVDPSPSTSPSPSCPPDLQVLLRDFSVKLAENRLMIQQLQRETLEQAVKLERNEAVILELRMINHEQDCKLRELQSKTNEVDPLKEQLREQTGKLTALESQQQEQTAKLTDFGNKVESQHQEQTGKVMQLESRQHVQDTELWSLKSRSNETENHVQTLRRDREEGRVSFSATLLASGSAYIGPYDTDTTLHYRHVFSNLGNAYNLHTGIFTAPVRGLYHFEYRVHSYSHNAHIVLEKNTERIITAYEDETSGHGNAGNEVTVLLEPGDEVYLRLKANTRIYDDSGRYNTFSGRLLFLM